MSYTLIIHINGTNRIRLRKFYPILLFKLIVGIIIGICYYLTLSYLLKWEEIDFILSLILKKHRQ